MSYFSNALTLRNRPNIATESDGQVNKPITTAWSTHTSVKCTSVRIKQ